ncbi:hypothetical protein WIW50_15005 [Flavobacteriaceae bacterium 3-367]
MVIIVKLYPQVLRWGILILFFVAQPSCNGIESEVTPNEDIIDFQILDRDGEPIQGSIVGDGDARLVLRANISENADNGFRNITFSATMGIFEQTGKDTEAKRVDSEGQAEVIFRVPLSDDEIFFTAEIGSGEDIFRAENSLKLIDVGQVVTLAVLDSEKHTLNEEVRADGNTILTLAATVNFNQDDFKKITFKNSNGGSFLGVNATEAKVNIDENNVAFLQYQVPNKVGRMFFEAMVDGNDAIFNTANIDLIRSYPDSIVVEPAAISVALNNNVSIDAYLLKSLGKVSEGTAPKFEAFQIGDSGERIEVGRLTGIPEALTDGNGKVTVTFFADSPNIDQTKPIIIKVNSKDDADNVVSEQLQLEIKQ